MSTNMQLYWRANYVGNEHRFIEVGDKIYPIVSGGRANPTTVSISEGVADVANLRITWVVTFSNAGLGFDSDDITPTPSSATVGIGGRGNRRLVTLTLNSIYDIGSFVLDAAPFGDRILTSSLAARTSNRVSFLPQTTVAIQPGSVDTATRSVSWIVRFSNAGTGLTILDINEMPSTAVVSIEGSGNVRTVRMTFPGVNALSGTASFTLAAIPFEDRVLIGDTPPNPPTLTSDSVAYTFGTAAEPPPVLVRDATTVPRPLESDWQVILGMVDITDYVLDISNIQRSLDENLTYQFRVAEATIRIANSDGEFSSHNENNLFVAAGVSQFGIDAKVQIISGNQLLFVGNLIETRHQEESGEIEWVISDPSVDINNKEVVDFGIEKRMKLSAANREESAQSGVYPFPTAVVPVSDGSASGIIGSTGQRLFFKDAVQREGDLDPRNVAIVDDELQTEGRYLDEGSDPLVEFRAPRRNVHIQNVVEDVLTHYGIYNRSISVDPILSRTSQFHAIGRVGYATEASQRDGLGNLNNEDEWQWTGYVTDFILDASGPAYSPVSFFSLSGIAEHRGNLYAISRNGYFYIVSVATRNFTLLGNIQNGLGTARVEGLASAQDRLFILTRDHLYELHFLADNEFATTQLTLTETDAQNMANAQIDADGTFSTQKGFVVGLTARGDELFLGYRQGINRVEINGDQVNVIDFKLYADIMGIDSRPSTNSIEYLDGRFYSTGRLASEFKLFSFEMEFGYEPKDIESHSGAGITSQFLGSYQGNLIGGVDGGKYLAYINGGNGALTRLFNPTFYFLYSARQSTTIPKLLRYEVLRDKWDVVYTHYEHAEFWRIISDDFDTFYILGNEAGYDGTYPRRAAYNALYHSGATPNTNTIWQYKISANSIDTRVDASSALRPQLAQYYHLGFEGTQNRYGFLPDSRKGLALNLGHLYYIYSTDDAVGIAKLPPTGTPTSVFSSDVDNWHNECGMDFRIHDDTIYAGITFIEGENSTLKFVSYSLGQAPRFARFTETALTENTAYDQSVRAIGDPAPTITSCLTTGTLPTGLTLAGARLHGTPTGIPATGTEFTVTFTAQNERGEATSTINFRVADENAASPLFGTFTATSLTVGAAYDQSITATGTPTPVITSELNLGALPDGLTLAGPRLHGTPSAAGTFTITFTATNSEGSVTTDIAFTVA